MAKQRKGGKQRTASIIPAQTISQSNRRFCCLAVRPATYLAIRRLADHHSLSLCDTVALLVDAGCIGAGLKERGRE